MVISTATIDKVIIRSSNNIVISFLSKCLVIFCSALNCITTLTGKYLVLTFRALNFIVSFFSKNGIVDKTTDYNVFIIGTYYELTSFNDASFFENRWYVIFVVI